MIKPQDKVFANLIQQLQQDLPQEPLTRIVNLAAVAMGILRSKSLQVGQIVTASPLAGSRDSLKKRVSRFLKNPDVVVDEYYSPLAQRMLKRLVAGGARGHLTLDRTEWSDFNIIVCLRGVAGAPCRFCGAWGAPARGVLRGKKGGLKLSPRGWLPEPEGRLLASGGVGP